jgi:sensor domain CHASE-containing protein
MRVERPMTVRRKTIVIIAITFLGLVAVVYGVARTVILGNARQNEELSGNRNMQRILDVLDERMLSLNRFSLDRSSLDSTYDFVAHPDHQMELTLFGENNRTNPAARRASFLILLDNSGHTLAQRKLYLPDGESREIPETLRSQLVPGSVALRHAELTQSTGGVVMAPEGPLLIVSRAVLKTDGGGPSRGALLSAVFSIATIWTRWKNSPVSK